MLSQRLAQLLSWPLLLTTFVSAQRVIDTLSFGHGSTLSPNGRALPNWHLAGSNHQVQILSDRVILTPPVPGNARGAAWSDLKSQSSDWTVEFEFRASGQETGTGNMQVWYTKDKDAVAQNSVYTVGNFDGFVLVLDQYGGTGGKLRGFLNDGTVDYKAHGSLESLAFGHCDYSYRNLGRPSKLRIVNKDGLSVSIDDRECFRTNKVDLPHGYYFGVTAATSDNPDSFEVNKFIVSTTAKPSNANRAPTLQKLDRFPGAPEAVPDKSADEIKSQEAQFEDLHNRLQGMTHSVANLFGEFAQLSQRMEEQHAELMASLPKSSESVLNDLRHKMDDMDRRVQQVQRDFEGRDYGKHLTDLQQSLDHVKGGLTDALPDTMNRLISASAPRMGTFVALIVAFQILLVAAYILYKRRRASMPKKYL